MILIRLQTMLNDNKLLASDQRGSLVTIMDKTDSFNSDRFYNRT